MLRDRVVRCSLLSVCFAVLAPGPTRLNAQVLTGVISAGKRDLAMPNKLAASQRTVTEERVWRKTAT